MNNRVLVLVGIAVIVVLILSVIFSQTSLLGPTTSVTPTVQPTGYSSTVPTKSQTYQEFVKSGRSEICTFSNDIKNGTSNGTVYAASGKIRTDFTMSGPNGNLQMHFLIDSYTGYLWNNLNTNGVKFPVTEINPNDNLISYINLHCNPWTPSMSVFDLPPDISFTEVTSQAVDDIKKIIPPTSAPTGQ